MSLQIFICDDDNIIVDKLQKYIIEYFKQRKLKVPKIFTYNNGEDLLHDSSDKILFFLISRCPGLTVS